jgi:hypothetical protein
MPGKMAHAISATRRAVEAGARSAVRAGETTTDCKIASWAMKQHATAIQKIASAMRRDIARSDG